MRGNQKSAGSRRRVLDDLARLGLDKFDDGFDQRARGEILPGLRFAFRCRAFEQAFVEIAQAVFFGGIPIDVVDGGDQRRQRGGLGQRGLGVGETCLTSGKLMSARVPSSSSKAR